MHVEISPTHPLPLGHGAEYRVIPELEISTGLREPFHQTLELSQVRCKDARFRSTHFLIDLRQSRESAGPRQWEV